MSKLTLVASLFLLGFVSIGTVCHGSESAQPAEIARPSRGLATIYVGHLVNILTSDGGSYVRVQVLDQDERFLTIRFQNVPYSIPWSLITNIQIAG